MIMNYLAIICIILTVIIIVLIIIKPREKFADIQQPIENPETKDKIYPSYWYGYYPTDTRSKCFDCDSTSKYEHGTTCFDCEIPGGRQVNSLLNRVLTR